MSFSAWLIKAVAGHVVADPSITIGGSTVGSAKQLVATVKRMRVNSANISGDSALQRCGSAV